MVHAVMHSSGDYVASTTSKVAIVDRERRNGHPGCVVWLTGLSASGKSTIAVELERRLFGCGHQVVVLDGDTIRKGLCSDLGFAANDRTENTRRIGEVAKLMAQSGMICIAAFISPYRADRLSIRRNVTPGRFIEVYVRAPIEVCEARDPKGLYAKARANQISEFTGISAPYEAPEEPELEIRTDQLSVEACVDRIVRHLGLLTSDWKRGVDDAQASANMDHFSGKSK